MIFNIVMSVAAVRIILKQNRKKYIQGGEKHLKTTTFKSIISIVWLVVLFGLGWVFGLLTIQQASTAFKYIFVIFNGFQGFYFFLFICVLQKESRDFWAMTLTCGHCTFRKVPTSSQNNIYGGSSAYKLAGKYASAKSSSNPKVQLTDYLVHPSVSDSKETELILSNSSTYTSGADANIMETSLDFDDAEIEGEVEYNMQMESPTFRDVTENVEHEVEDEHQDNGSLEQTKVNVVPEETDEGGTSGNMSVYITVENAGNELEMESATIISNINAERGSEPAANEDPVNSVHEVAPVAPPCLKHKKNTSSLHRNTCTSGTPISAERSDHGKSNSEAM